jgi:hypothetical protein
MSSPSVPRSVPRSVLRRRRRRSAKPDHQLKTKRVKRPADVMSPSLTDDNMPPSVPDRESDTEDDCAPPQYEELPEAPVDEEVKDAAPMVEVEDAAPMVEVKEQDELPPFAKSLGTMWTHVARDLIDVPAVEKFLKALTMKGVKMTNLSAESNWTEIFTILDLDVLERGQALNFVEIFFVLLKAKGVSPQVAADLAEPHPDGRSRSDRYLNVQADDVAALMEVKYFPVDDRDVYSMARGAAMPYARRRVLDFIEFEFRDGRLTSVHDVVVSWTTVSNQVKASICTDLQKPPHELNFLYVFLWTQRKWAEKVHILLLFCF